MATARRSAPRAATVSSNSGVTPLLTALLLGSSLAYGVGTLVARGRMDWPPTELLASLYTVAGCLALVGPILLMRRSASELGLGELIWMTGGLLVWIFDAAALIRGATRTIAWATPLEYQPMGLTILAVALGAWRGRSPGAHWTWTNVLGWLLGVFWVAMAASTLLPARTLGLVLR